MKSNQERKPDPAPGKEPLRLLALSDGLFATVLTLLVLDLRIPEAVDASGGSMAGFFRWLGPHLFSYLLTFLVAGMYWIGHHRDFDHVVRYDRGLMGYNLLFLLFIGLLPFTTAAISLGGFSSAVPSASKPAYITNAWALYAGNLVLAWAMLQLTWNYALSHRLVDPEMSAQQGRYISVRQTVVPVMFLLSILLEYLFPRKFLGPFILLGIPLAQSAVDRFVPGAEPRSPSRLPVWQKVFWRAGSLLVWAVVLGLAIWAMSL